MADATLPRNEDSPRGMAFALSAYLIWGFLPVYMKALSHIPAYEVVAHRVIWSVPVALAVLVALGRTQDLRAALRSPRMLLMAAATAALISVNWGSMSGPSARDTRSTRRSAITSTRCSASFSARCCWASG